MTDQDFRGLQFNDLLLKRGYDLKDVLIIRHTPTEPKLRRALPWLVAEHREVFEAYQSTQEPDPEKRMKNRPYLASFIGPDSGGPCVFVGLYRQNPGHEITVDEFWDAPGAEQLKEFGVKAFDPTNRSTIYRFNYELVTDFFPELIGRLECPIPHRNGLRKAESNVFMITAIHPSSVLVLAIPPWNELVLTWEELKVIPETWKAKLQEWRGVYYIFDTEIQQGYVGSAAGRDNLLGRWLNYKDTGHGGNKKFLDRNPANFRFSILERVSPDMDAAEVCEVETRWKIRLHTREHGLNKN
ncbi:hypothetical protein Sp245p_28800 (plasmid) [Azospirillum baldaniorum]|uniref:GIY-YIG domain-containing protein n=1 Tax=Azospirillum baldaniorum TaxID=1064539 RepID=A0A9P1JY27_9PROT|nr:GIY-YIG nuclease family protein [Azospirillum baldaniorum]AWJ93822.1 hypothetical protein Sp245p_28800 [Azospirillum baldaniorum]TWA81645.1 hypothetical protein FBZ85_10219 [Azospirillum brasilense]CCD01978.1 conserved protein of unknown function [Azospirillum baldaniorum]